MYIRFILCLSIAFYFMFSFSLTPSRAVCRVDRIIEKFSLQFYAPAERQLVSSLNFVKGTSPFHSARSGLLHRLSFPEILVRISDEVKKNTP